MAGVVGLNSSNDISRCDAETGPKDPAKPAATPSDCRTQYELIDKDGRVCGTYPTATAAGLSAQRCWPNEQQDEDRTGKGWDISVVGADR